MQSVYLHCSLFIICLEDKQRKCIYYVDDLLIINMTLPLLNSYSQRRTRLLNVLYFAKIPTHVRILGLIPYYSLIRDLAKCSMNLANELLRWIHIFPHAGEGEISLTEEKNTKNS